MKMNKYVVLLILAVLVSSISQIVLKKSASKSYNSVLKEYLNEISRITKVIEKYLK